jgi:hypothetical protein
MSGNVGGQHGFVLTTPENAEKSEFFDSVRMKK